MSHNPNTVKSQDDTTQKHNILDNLKGKYIDLTGHTFGRLKVINLDHKTHYKWGTILYWKCKCSCGNEKIIRGLDLKNGKTKSCGCILKEKREANKGSKEQPKKYLIGNTKHGLHHTRIYKIWQGLKKRCYNKSYRAYEYYGGKGVIVCDEWLNDVKVFYNWAINNGYKENLSIDRINSDGNYSPENCRWADSHIQGINQKIQRNNKSGYKGARFSEKYKKYISEITIYKKHHIIGYFNNLYEAVMARNNYIIQNNLSEYKIQEWRE